MENYNLEQRMKEIARKKTELFSLKENLKSCHPSIIQQLKMPLTKGAYEDYRRVLEEDIRVIEAYLNNENIALGRIAGFSFDDVIMFLAQSISIIEQEEYDGFPISLNEPKSSVRKWLKDKLDLLQEEDYYIITTRKNQHLLAEKYRQGNVLDKDDVFRLVTDDKVILLDKQEEFKLTETTEWNMIAKFENKYPYLSNLLLVLFAEKMNYKTVSDELLIQRALQHVCNNPLEFKNKVKQKR